MVGGRGCQWGGCGGQQVAEKLVGGGKEMDSWQQ